MSNAVTDVKIGNKTMKVAEAIEKKTSISFKTKLLEKMRRELMYANDEVEDINSNVERRLDELLRTAVGNKSETAFCITSEQEAIAKPFLDRNGAELFDPLNLQGKIDALDEEIDEFITNVDVSLSESNSTTYIEV